MSFTDPLLVTPIGGTSTQFARISDGRYMQAGSTMDQPAYMLFKNTLKVGGTSRFVAEYQAHKNVVGQVGQPAPADDICRLYTVLEVPHRSFPDNDVVVHLKMLRGFLGDDAHILRLLTGQK